MKKISIKTVAIVAIVLTTVVFTFSPYLYAGDDPNPLNPDPDIDGFHNLCLTGGHGPNVESRFCIDGKCQRAAGGKWGELVNCR